MNYHFHTSTGVLLCLASLGMSVFTQHVIDQVDSREEIASVKRLANSEGGGPSVQTAPILELLTIPRGNQG